MQVPHLLERECRLLAARFNAPVIFRRAAFWAAIGTAAIVFLDQLFSFSNPGKFIFLGLFLPVVIFLIPLGAGVGASLFEHRRNQMLGLLFLTRSRPQDFFFAQIGARIAAAFYFSMSLLPCFVLSMLYGAVRWETCLGGAIFIVLEVIFLIAFEFVGGALAADAGLAALIAKVTRGVFIFWPWVVDRVAQAVSGFPLPRAIYLFSPLSAGLQLFRGLKDADDIQSFLLTCLTVSAISILALLGSAWILTNTWREEESPWRQLRPVAIISNWLARRNRTWAKGLRPHLDCAPLAWHAAFDQGSVRNAWISLAAIWIGWLAGLATFGTAWRAPAIFYLAAAASIYAVRLQMLLRIAKRFSEPRENSHFDFLRASGHSAKEIIEGEIRGLFLQFSIIVWVVRVLTLVSLMAPLFTRTWSHLALFQHAIIASFLLWVSSLRPRSAILQTMWVSINTGQGISAVFRKSSVPLANFGYQFYRILSGGIAGLTTFPGGSNMGAGVTAAIAVFVAILSHVFEETGQTRHDQLLKHFWDILQSPLRPADEIAKWNQEAPLTS